MNQDLMLSPAQAEERLRVWETIKDSVSTGFSKRQLEFRKRYFMGETVPKGALYPGEYVIYTPDFSREGLAHVFKTLIDETTLEEHQYGSICANFSLTLRSWPGASADDKVALFYLAHGELHNGEKRFPFKIGGENHFRDMFYNTDGLFSVLTGRFVSFLKTDDENNLFWSRLVEYYISMFDQVSPWMYTMDLDMSGVPDKVGGFPTRSFDRRLREFMEGVLQSASDSFLDRPFGELKRPSMLKINSCFESLTPTSELAEKWARVKQGAHYE